MDVHAVRLDIAHQVALQIITYIGCIISVVCLVLAILTFQLFRGLKVIIITLHDIEFYIDFEFSTENLAISFSRTERPSTRISACACWSRKFYSFAESGKRTRELSAVSSLDYCISFSFAHSPGCSSKVSILHSINIIHCIRRLSNSRTTNNKQAAQWDKIWFYLEMFLFQGSNYTWCWSRCSKRKNQGYVGIIWSPTVLHYWSWPFLV